jgi:hypothetical protein
MILILDINAISEKNFETKTPDTDSYHQFQELPRGDWPESG